MPNYVRSSQPFFVPRPSATESKFDASVKQFNTEAKEVIAKGPNFSKAQSELTQISSRILAEYNEYLTTRVADNHKRNDLWIEMNDRLNTRVHMTLIKAFPIHERPVIDVLDIIDGRA